MVRIDSNLSCSDAKADVTTIGGALEGFSGSPGSARSSYGMSSVPDVLMECLFRTLHQLTRPLEADDYSTYNT